MENASLTERLAQAEMRVCCEGKREGASPGEASNGLEQALCGDG